MFLVFRIICFDSTINQEQAHNGNVRPNRIL